MRGVQREWNECGCRAVSPRSAGSSNVAEPQEGRRLPLALVIELGPTRGTRAVHHARFIENPVSLSPAFLEMLRLIADAEIVSTLLPRTGGFRRIELAVDIVREDVCRSHPADGIPAERRRAPGVREVSRLHGRADQSCAQEIRVTACGRQPDAVSVTPSAARPHRTSAS
jgi:hypothetical protein